MPLDGISTRCLSAELDAALKDARVDRIYQPDRFDIIINMRQDRENLRLLLSANPSLPRLHLTTETRENPALPPMFCMLLRKHLQGARVLSVSTPGSERIIELRFQTQNELGDKVEKTLIAELMGRHSNIIFLNEDRRIHDAIVHVDESISRVREVMPARVYISPPDQGKRSIETA
ncbi:MAG: fibronectin/fibrinogen-binding protein, partial [Ruminococcaceae bacterium]|nr:fibronectin/fibrinogen-binding protein [Oscillospiraceae bacterium]